MRLRAFVLVLVILSGVGCRPDPAAPPPILYLSPDAAGVTRLVRQSAPGAVSHPLTGAGAVAHGSVVDFALSPNGSKIAYSVEHLGGGTALHVVGADGDDDRRVLDCADAECTTPVWAPDGRRLLYERRDAASGARLYWLDVTTGETIPLVSDSTSPSYGAAFSPDGRWLSYVSPQNEGVVLFDLTGDRQRLLPSRVGWPAAWSPDGGAVITGDIVLDSYSSGPETGATAPVIQETARTHLYRTQVDHEGTRELISSASNVHDSAPSWSPDGEWIAFGRQPAAAQTGRQLWIMRADGSEARALTDEPSIAHGPAAWSPDGRFLLFQRFDLADAGALPGVWLYDLETSKLSQVASTGYLPAWAR